MAIQFYLRSRSSLTMVLFSWIIGRKRDFLIEFMSSHCDLDQGPRPGSSPRYRVQTPYLGFEFLSGLLDSGAFIWRLDCAEPHGLLGDLVNVPAHQLRRRFRFSAKWASIGRELCRFNAVDEARPLWGRIL
jgi:hypothetical protein